MFKKIFGLSLACVGFLSLAGNSKVYADTVLDWTDDVPESVEGTGSDESDEKDDVVIINPDPVVDNSTINDSKENQELESERVQVEKYAANLNASNAFVLDTQCYLTKKHSTPGISEKDLLMACGYTDYEKLTDKFVETAKSNKEWYDWNFKQVTDNFDVIKNGFLELGKLFGIGD